MHIKETHKTMDDFEKLQNISDDMIEIKHDIDECKDMLSILKISIDNVFDNEKNICGHEWIVVRSIF